MKSIRRLSCLLFLLIGLTSIWLYLSSTIIIGSELLRGDQWVWMKDVIMPLESNQMGLLEAITYEYSAFSHSHIISLSSFLIDYHFFGFNLYTDKVIGITSATLSVILITKFNHIKNEPIIALSAFAISALFIFSSDANIHFSWTLLQVYQYTTLLAILFPIAILGALEKRHSRTIIFLVVVIVSIFGGGISSAAMVALPIALILKKSHPAKEILFIIFSIIIVNLFLSQFVQGQRMHSGTSFLEFFQSVIIDPGQFVQSNLNIFSRSFYYIKKSAEIQPLVGSLTIFILIVMALHFIFYSKSKKSILPICLILTVGIWALGVQKSRLVNFGPQYMFASRYAIFMHLAAIGSCLYFFQEIWAGKLSTRSKYFSILAVVTLLSAINIPIYYQKTFEQTQYAKKYLSKRYQALYDFDNSKDISALLDAPCRNKACNPSIELLKRNNLNVFNDERD